MQVRALVDLQAPALGKRRTTATLDERRPGS
jgi:hypothetical protein